MGSTSVEAQIEAEVLHGMVRTLVLEPVESATEGELKYRKISESLESHYQYTLRSAGEEIDLEFGTSRGYEQVNLPPTPEHWIFTAGSETLSPIRFEGPLGEVLDLEGFNEVFVQNGVTVTGLVGFNFTTVELPNLNSEPSSLEIDLERPVAIECETIKDNRLRCYQMGLFKSVFRTDEYENFRELGIEPVLVLRGTTHGA